MSLVEEECQVVDLDKCGRPVVETLEGVGPEGFRVCLQHYIAFQHGNGLLFWQDGHIIRVWTVFKDSNYITAHQGVG
jgi:hypothetical protein